MLRIYYIILHYMSNTFILPLHLHTFGGFFVIHSKSFFFSSSLSFFSSLFHSISLYSLSLSLFPSFFCIFFSPFCLAAICRRHVDINATTRTKNKLRRRLNRQNRFSVECVYCVPWRSNNDIRIFQFSIKHAFTINSNKNLQKSNMFSLSLFLVLCSSLCPLQRIQDIIQQ